jgi:hypothetical protein
MTADTGLGPEKQLASEPPSLASQLLQGSGVLLAGAGAACDLLIFACTQNLRQKKSQAADGRLGFKNA